MNSHSATIQEIVERYKQGEKEAINELPPHMEKMIYSILQPYKRYPDIEDMYQVAWQTIMRCLNKYDAGRGALFTSFVYTAIKRDLWRYRKSVDKHKSNYNGDNVCTMKVMPLEGKMQVTVNGVKVTKQAIDMLVMEDRIDEHTALLDLRIILPEILEEIQNAKVRAIIIDYINEVKQKEIAERYDVSAAYVSKVISDFLIKCKKRLMTT